MKKLIIAAALLCASSTIAFAGPIQYPPGASPHAIAVDQMMKRHAKNVTYCAFIDTRTGRCTSESVLNAGGGGDGGGSGGGSGGAGGGDGGGAGGGGSGGGSGGGGGGSGGGGGGGGGSGGGGAGGCK